MLAKKGFAVCGAQTPGACQNSHQISLFISAKRNQCLIAEGWGELVQQIPCQYRWYRRLFNADRA